MMAASASFPVPGGGGLPHDTACEDPLLELLHVLARLRRHPQGPRRRRRRRRRVTVRREVRLGHDVDPFMRSKLLPQLRANSKLLDNQKNNEALDQSS